MSRTIRSLAWWFALRLKIGQYEIPKDCLKAVITYPDSCSASFVGVFRGLEGQKAAAGLRILAEQRAVPFEVVDSYGVECAGLCDVRDLKLVAINTAMIKFSGRLVRPFGG